MITVELFGIPRQRAGVAEAFVAGDRLGGVLRNLADHFPTLAEVCIDGERLQSGFLCNLNGERFVSDPNQPLRPGDALLILSADPGG